MKTPPVGTLLKVSDAGGELLPVGDKLRMVLPADCDPSLKDEIRANKAEILELMRLNFLIVRCAVSVSPVFWVPDETTKERLVFHGVPAGQIYTASELRELVSKRTTCEELAMIHTAKEVFSGRIRTKL